MASKSTVRSGVQEHLRSSPTLDALVQPWLFLLNLPNTRVHVLNGGQTFTPEKKKNTQWDTFNELTRTWGKESPRPSHLVLLDDVPINCHHRLKTISIHDLTASMCQWAWAQPGQLGASGL